MKISDGMKKLFDALGDKEIVTRDMLIAQSDLIREIGGKCERTPLYERSRDKVEQFVKNFEQDPRVEDRLLHAWWWLMDRIVNAPTQFHMDGSVILTMPLVAKYLPALSGKELIAAERQRQIEKEGWSEAHDDTHGPGALEAAALCYRDAVDEVAEQPSQWPWDSAWWKPKGRQRNLERAGGLYQAAADAAARAGDYQQRDRLLCHVESCANLLDGLLQQTSGTRPAAG